MNIEIDLHRKRENHSLVGNLLAEALEKNFSKISSYP